MTAVTSSPPVPADAARGPATAVLGVGFGYWLVLLLMLEPGNVQRAVQAHLALDWGQEAVRILGASLLGTATTPLLVAQARRFPLDGAHRWRHAARQLVAAVAIAAGLIVVSCLCARMVLVAERRPLRVAMGQELLENWALLTVWIVLFIALGHAFLVRDEPRRPVGAELPALAADADADADNDNDNDTPLEAVTVQVRGLPLRVSLDTVDWLDSQGNYVALHVGASTHLVRDQLARFAARLPPDRFVRIHRRTIVAVDRVAALVPLGSGDGLVQLRDGTELRLSRTYRATFEAVIRDDGAVSRGLWS